MYSFKIHIYSEISILQSCRQKQKKYNIEEFAELNKIGSQKYIFKQKFI